MEGLQRMIDVYDEIKKTIANRAYKLEFNTVYELVDDHLERRKNDA